MPRVQKGDGRRGKSSLALAATHTLGLPEMAQSECTYIQDFCFPEFSLEEPFLWYLLIIH